MTFDFGTLTAAGGLVAFVSGLLLVFAWTQYDSGRAALRLSLSHLLGAGGIILLAFGGLQHPFLPMLAQPIFVLAAFLALSSVLAFEKRDRPLPLLLAAGCCFAALVTLTVTGNNADLVRILQLAIASTLFVMSAWLLWRGNHERLAARLPLAAVLLLHGLMNSVGLAEAVLRESLPSGMPSFSQWYGLIHIESMVYFMGTALFMVVLLKERSEARHKTASLTDPLTGLSNRRAFFYLCDRMLERCHRTGAPCTVLVVDLDRFKAVNDTFGHAVGDCVLQVFAAVAHQELRSFDIIGRLGGEEFAVLLPRTHSREGAEIARRLKEAFSTAARTVGDHEVSGTLSIGVAVVLGGETTIGEALERADAALYRAKLNGRDRVEVDAGVHSVRSLKATGS
jgi:diguanylate cyclase (GGDEF)-like protein